MKAVGITDGPPNCARDLRAVVLSCSHLAWFVVDTQVKACSREIYSLSRVSKIYVHKAFQIAHLHVTVINSSRATLYSPPHTLCSCAVEPASALTAAILADAAVTLPSPK